MLQKILFTFVCFGLFLNQVGRIDLGNDIAFTVLDLSVFLFSLYSLCRHWEFIQQKVLKLPKLFIVFFIFAAVASIWNLHNYTFFQNCVAILYFFRFGMYVFFATAVMSMLKETKNKRFVLISLLTTGISIVIAGFVQYIFYSNLRNLYYLGWDDHLYRLFSTFLDPNFAGAFFALFFFFLGGLFFSFKFKHNTYKKILLLILLCTTLFALFLTFSRSALIMLFVGAFVFLWLQRKIRYIFIIIIGFIVALIIVSPKLSIENTNYFRAASSEARIGSATTALQIIQRNPFFGVGFDAYRYAQEKYGYRQEKTFSGAVSHADAGTDNSFLFVFATTGILGIVCYLFGIFSIVKMTYKESKQRIFSAVFVASMISVIVDAFFINSLFYPSILLWLGAIYAIRD